jgi:hypothetical protein
MGGFAPLMLQEAIRTVTDHAASMLWAKDAGANLLKVTA